MAKLYPPYIEGTLPAFCLDSKGNGVLAIPFAHNKAVNINEVSNYAIKIKSVQNDILLDNAILSNGLINEDISFAIENYTFIQDNNSITFKIGQSYKIQVAYINTENVIGYYSTVGVIKCTSEPEVSIEGFEENKINSNQNEFIGIYRQGEGGDVTEKVYSSEFIITDSNKNEIATSGEILHNVENNPNSYESYDIMKFNKDLEFGEICEIVYKVKTNNGLVYSSPRYKIAQQKSLTMELKGKLVAEMNSEDGFVDVKIEGYIDPDTEIEEIGLGAFVLTREDSLKPGYWDELHRFSLEYESPTKTIFRDFTVEQGKTYTYSIQQYNSKNVYSSRRKSNSVIADFEDMFLFDGERQLKLRFNPQVSSFKTQLAETRTETIGSKYPFFFRNARIGYKTFPVSGLISMLSDDNQFFITYDEILRYDKKSDHHNIDSDKQLNPNFSKGYNNLEEKNFWTKNNLIFNEADLNLKDFVSERLFKLAVLDWMNNGKVKLFRSPGEGNYLVRMMDNSLSPQTALGRMLHTLSGTAYECAENIHSNLIKYGIIEDNSNKGSISTGQVLITNWSEVRFNELELVKDKMGNKDIYRSNNLLISDLGDKTYTTNIRIEDALPGTQFRLVFATHGGFKTNLYTDITIGATGSYYADNTEKIYGIYYISPKEIPVSGGSLLYEHETIARSSNMFDSIEEVEIDIGAYAQLVGEKNVINSLTTTKEQVARIQMCNFIKRPIEYLYCISGDFADQNKIISGEDIFNQGINSQGYRDLRGKYFNKLYWNIPTGNLVALSLFYNIIIHKEKNSNGLPEDWWELQNWATCYARVHAVLDGKNPDILTENELKEYYPIKQLKEYKTVANGVWNTTISNQLGYDYTDTNFDNKNRRWHVIYDVPSEQRWERHAVDCGHTYEQTITGNSINAKIPENGFAYIYKPTLFDKEDDGLYKNIQYVVDEYTNDIIFINPSQGTDADWFDDKENMEYSPFSLYILRDENLTINGVKENIITHLTDYETSEEKTHVANHLFERYYIDRYLNAQTAEEMLTERSLLSLRAAAGEDSDIIEESTPLYVLDPWYGKIYEVGKDFIYNPAITYCDNNIDLREIDRYSLENLDPEDGDINIGNGIYGEIFYQKVIVNYDIESNICAQMQTKYNDFIDYNSIDNATQDIIKTENNDNYYYSYQTAKTLADKEKDEYNELLRDMIINWTKKQV